jgi:uncharacterized membrane protein YcaP (DUF421 family)
MADWGEIFAFIMDGRINQKALRRELMTHEELLEELRLRGISDVSTVARAYLEMNGMLSVLTKEPREAEEPASRQPLP